MNQPVVLILVAAAAGFGGGWVAQAVAEPAPRPRAASTTPTTGVAAATELRQRIVVLEERGARRRAESERVETPVRRARREEESVIEIEKSEEESSLLARVLGRTFGRAQSDEMYRTLGVNHGDIEATIAELRRALAKNPDDADLHCALATALGAKTAFITPRGPEQGVVWDEAKKSFKEAQRLDPNHWEARYSLAFGDSMAPEFVGLRPKVIEQFHELIEIQEAGNPEEFHALAYMRLGTMYKQAGNMKKARAVWKRGLERHGEDRQLRDALAIAAED